jgi:hypothetical protein
MSKIPFKEYPCFLAHSRIDLHRVSTFILSKSDQLTDLLKWSDPVKYLNAALALQECVGGGGGISYSKAHGHSYNGIRRKSILL